MVVFTDPEHLLNLQATFHLAAQNGDIPNLVQLIAEHTVNGKLNPHFSASRALWHAFVYKNPKVIDVMKTLWPYMQSTDDMVEEFLTHAIQVDQLECVAFLIAKHSTQNFSTALTLATRLQKIDIVKLLLFHTIEKDIQEATQLFISGSQTVDLVQTWLPYLSQENIDQALIESAIKNSPKVVEILAPLCSVEVCEQAIFEAFYSTLNCLDCVDVLRPFVGTVCLYGLYSNLSFSGKRRYTKETLALLPMIDVNRWNGLAAQESYTDDVLKIFYPHCNPYQIQGLLRIKYHFNYPYDWTNAIEEDEQNADTHRMEQLRQMKCDAQPILDFVQAVKDGNTSYIANAEATDNTVNGAFVMSMLWNNESPQHLLHRGVWDDSMWGALLEAIKHKSMHLPWLINQYDYTQCPKRKIYAHFVANMLLNKRLFNVFQQMLPAFSHLDLHALAFTHCYKGRLKAVNTALNNAPPPLSMLRHLIENGHSRWVKLVMKQHPQYDYLPVIEECIRGPKPGNTFVGQQRGKIIHMLALHQVQQQPEDLENLLHIAIEERDISVIHCLLPLADQKVCAQLLITAVKNNFEYFTFFSQAYDKDIYSQAMVNAAYYGNNECVDNLWAYTDVEDAHTRIYDGGYTNKNCLYFYERLEQERQRCLLMEAVQREHDETVSRRL